MEYEVIISKRAEKNLKSIFEYLESEWSDKVKNNFKIKLLRQVDFLRKNPFIYPASRQKKEVRKCLITKHNAMYYRINKNKVEIITIQDTRRANTFLNIM